MNVSQPLVSIALATYNGDRFLSQQIDSLIQQTYKNFEIIISDDESTDDTHTLLQEYSKKDSRIVWSSNGRRLGFKKNFERAINLCRGEIIFLCDQDDIWDKEKIEKHVKAYTQHNVAWVYNKVVLTDEGNQKIGYLTDKLPDYYKPIRRKLLNYTWGACILGCATSYKKEHIQAALPISIQSPGHDAWIQLVIWPQKPYFIDEVLQEYRQHANNVVGVKNSSGEEATLKEQKAIEDNKEYLRALSKAQPLSIWKRKFFLLVYVAKKMRTMIV